MSEQFKHAQYGHCESGAVAALVSNFGFSISEPMVMGLGAGMCFAHFPFIKMGGLPLTAYRVLPRALIKGVQKRLGIKMHQESFKDKDIALSRLRELLQEKKAVGIQASVFYLPYFPDHMRFHFNGHNLIVYGEKDGQFLVSDPCFEAPVTVPVEDLQRARFTKGAFAAKGFMYYPTHVPERVDIVKGIKPAIMQVVHMMLHAPFPYIGIRGMQYLANSIEKLPKKHNKHYMNLFLGHIIRMQEEIGTGGGGFRYMYAAFLQEAAGLLPDRAELLLKASESMTEVGDLWREFAVQTAKYIQNKSALETTALSELIRAAAAKEKVIYQMLMKI